MSFLEICKYKNLFIFVLIFSNSIIADDKKLLILGDSISAGFGIKESQNWTNLLKSSFSKEGKSLEIINSSISGDTTSGGLSRINRDLNTYKPDFVLVELGGNDALRGYPISRIKQNLLKIVSLISRDKDDIGFPSSSKPRLRLRSCTTAFKCKSGAGSSSFGGFASSLRIK